MPLRTAVQGDRGGCWGSPQLQTLQFRPADAPQGHRAALLGLVGPRCLREFMTPLISLRTWEVISALGLTGEWEALILLTEGFRPVTRRHHCFPWKLMSKRLP